VVVLAAAAAVSVAVCAVALLKVSEDEEKLHVGILLAPEGDLLIPQVSVTVPVNALPGVTVMVAVLVDPGLTVIAPPLESEKPAVLPLLGACQKSPQPARTPADKQTATGAATAINRRAHHPILIAAPFRSPSEPVHPGPRRLPYPRRPASAHSGARSKGIASAPVLSRTGIGLARPARNSQVERRAATGIRSDRCKRSIRRRLPSVYWSAKPERYLKIPADLFFFPRRPILFA
jgi:hypothetical protein